MIETPTQVRLTADNFSQGFLVDEELMAGITADPEKSDSYVVFILRHTTGEYLGYQAFTALKPALDALNRIPRDWNFESISGGCGGGNCGKEGGSCGLSGSCGKKCSTGKC